MLHRVWGWLRQLVTEAPWYFWAYVVLTPLSFLVRHQESIILCSLVALAAYVFLLKTFGMLRSPSVYIFAITAYLMASTYIFDFFLGKSLHLYFTYMYQPYGYPEVYYAAGSAVCAALVSAVFAFIHKQSLEHALKTGLTVFFMIFPSTSGILLILFPFFAR